MTDHLIEIKRNDWIKLKEIFSPETPKSVIGLQTINNYIRWIEIDSNIENLHFYSLNGDWSDGTFVVKDRYHVYFDSLNESNERLAKLLNLLDYSKGVRFMHIRDCHYQIVIDLIQRKKMEIEYDDPNILYYLPKENVPSLDAFRVPETCYRRCLNENDAVKANRLWLFNHPGSLFYLKRLALFNPTCGIFTKTGDEMISSAFQIQTGLIGILFTSAEYRNQRFGQIVIAGLCEQIVKFESGLTAAVKEMNGASRAIFEKLGFQPIDIVHWIAISCDWLEEAIE